jgi:hypothetical protein
MAASNLGPQWDLIEMATPHPLRRGIGPEESDE